MPDELDSSPISDNAEGSEPADTGTPDSAEADTQGSIQAVDAPSGGADSAVADTQPADGTRSLTAGADTNTTQGEPLESRYKALFSRYNQEHQEFLNLQKQMQAFQGQFQQLQQQYAGINPQAISEYQKQQELPPWDPDSPKHQAFREYLAKAEFYDELARGETDQAYLQKIAEKQERALGQEGLQTLAKWQAWRRQEERERRINPEGYFRRLAREEAEKTSRTVLKDSSQRYQQMQAGVTEAQGWAKANPQLVTKENLDQIERYMQESGMPFNVAAAIVERDHYRSQVSSAEKKAQSAEEKERLLQGNAAGTISRNPRTGKKIDVRKYLADKGITDSREAIDELFNLDQQGLL